MNKKLLTAVVVTTLSASPAVFADANLYGSLDIGVQIVDPGSGYAGSDLFVNDLQGSGGSYLGWSANEDLGGGLKGLAKFELGMFTDTGNLDNQTTVSALPTTTATQLFQRQIWAGLSGGFGTITGGRQYREVFLVGAGGAYAYTNAQIGVFFLNTFTGVRQSDSIKYVSPTFGGGFSLAATYGPGEGTTAATKDNKYQDFALKWSSGPMRVGVAISSSTSGTVDTDTTILGGQYTFGPHTVYGVLATQDNSANTTDLEATSLGYKFNAGMGDIVVAIGTSENKKVANAESTLTSVAYYHRLSKTTVVSAAYGSMDNDTGAQLSLARQAVGTLAAGDDPTAWSFSIRRFF